VDCRRTRHHDRTRPRTTAGYPATRLDLVERLPRLQAGSYTSTYLLLPPVHWLDGCGFLFGPFCLPARSVTGWPDLHTTLQFPVTCGGPPPRTRLPSAGYPIPTLRTFLHTANAPHFSIPRGRTLFGRTLPPFYRLVPLMLTVTLTPFAPPVVGWRGCGRKPYRTDTTSTPTPALCWTAAAFPFGGHGCCSAVCCATFTDRAVFGVPDHNPLFYTCTAHHGSVSHYSWMQIQLHTGGPVHHIH